MTDPLPPGETAWSIGRWAIQSFGTPTLEVAEARAREEMDELVEAIQLKSDSARVTSEAADVVIVLCHLAATLNIDLWEAVENKMIINRRRQWESRGDGTAQHKKDS
tara:strand:+ start:591 stop:911 length:321 start_codon:yes stop_codon:yes gene_type:complete